ncbi:hypothetical protein C359_02480 [Cryptococcus neoformans Bt120]|nr:hypothetical protein C359_02480 [Cryptococcus neoformans var. grubii Bt120]
MRLLPIQKLYLPQSNDQGQSPNFCMSLKHPETVCVILHRTTKGLRIIFLIISSKRAKKWCQKGSRILPNDKYI